MLVLLIIGLLYVLPSIIAYSMLDHNDAGDNALTPLTYIPILNFCVICMKIVDKAYQKNTNKEPANMDIQLIQEKELPIREVENVYFVVDGYKIINLSEMRQFDNIFTLPDVMSARMKEYKFIKVITNNSLSYRLVKNA